MDDRCCAARPLGERGSTIVVFQYKVLSKQFNCGVFAVTAGFYPGRRAMKQALRGAG